MAIKGRVHEQKEDKYFWLNEIVVSHFVAPVSKFQSFWPFWLGSSFFSPTSDPILTSLRPSLLDGSRIMNHKKERNGTQSFSTQDLKLFRHYRVAQQSLECYLKGVNYTLMMVDLENDSRVKERCSKNKNVRFVFFKQILGKRRIISIELRSQYR